MDVEQGSAVKTACFRNDLFEDCKWSVRWNRESNESVYEKCSMGNQANGMSCGVVEWVKRNTLRWHGHIEKIGSQEFVKKMYMSEVWVQTVAVDPLRDGETE